jgi:hypothetical protein
MPSPGMALVSVRSYLPRSAGFRAGLLLPKDRNRSPDVADPEGVLQLAERGDHHVRLRTEPQGMYQFALADPDETFVRVGWSMRLRTRP